MKPEITFNWLGGPTFLLKPGSFKLLSDPMLAAGPVAFYMDGHPSTGEDEAPITRFSPLPFLDINNLDLVLISHLHSDHLDNAAIEMLSKESLLVAPTAQINSPKLQKFINRQSLGWWEEVLLGKEGEKLRITGLPAEHSHDASTNEALGIVNGYALQYTSGNFAYTIFWTGDTVWFEKIREIKKRLGKVDLLIPHMGAVGKDGPWGLMTLDSGEATKVVEIIQPSTVIPVHHHTFSHYTEPISMLAEKMVNSPAELRVLTEGQTAFL